jgi:hypothetical protein
VKTTSLLRRARRAEATPPRGSSPVRAVTILRSTCGREAVMSGAVEPHAFGPTIILTGCPPELMDEYLTDAEKRKRNCSHTTS